jgi:preprotein translocase subunit SecE
VAGNGDLGEGDLEGGAATAGGIGRRPRSDAPARSQKTGFPQFVRECAAELRKVQWPTRRHLWQACAIVVVVTVVLGVWIALLDSVLTKVATWLIDQYAAH